MNSKKKRFQECNLLEKLWRYRYYLLIPFKAIKITLFSLYYDNDVEKIPFESSWSIAKGLVQSKMNWYYTMKEVKERFNKINK